MKRSNVFTIIAVTGLLLVLALAAMLQMRKARDRARRVSCVSNLLNVSLSFRVWAHDNNGYYPMQTGFKDPQMRETLLTGQVARVFQVFSNELFVPKTLLCPADDRLPAIEWRDTSNTNISYTLALDATERRPEMVLVSDRNLAMDGQLLTGVVNLGTNSGLAWTRDLHNGAGNVVTASGSILRISSEDFRQQLINSGDPDNRLVFPQ